MSKKHDFLKSELNRDKHPEKMMKGGAAEQAAQQERAQGKGNTADHAVPGTPKLANDHNKVGHQEATQTHQGERTPRSRHDRQTVNGTMNVTQARTDGKGGGRGTRGGNVGGSG